VGEFIDVEAPELTKLYAELFEAANRGSN